MLLMFVTWRCSSSVQWDWLWYQAMDANQRTSTVWWSCCHGG